MKKDVFKISNQVLKSRLIVGTGKYKNFKETVEAVKASGADMVTVAVRRINILDKKKPLLTDYLNPKKIKYLPNTAGCFNAEESLRTLRLAREMGGWKMVKLEVLGDKKTLYPDMIETLKATQVLVKEGTGDEFGKYAQDAMRQTGEYYNFGIRLDAEYNIGKSWADTH